MSRPPYPTRQPNLAPLIALVLIFLVSCAVGTVAGRDSVLREREEASAQLAAARNATTESRTEADMLRAERDFLASECESLTTAWEAVEADNAGLRERLKVALEGSTSSGGVE